MFLIEILKALLTPLIAVITLYIAYQQYALAKHKTDVEVYDRRLKIYRETLKLLRSAEEDLSVTKKEYYEWELLIFEAELLSLIK